jgi:hypothetical protein
MITDPYCDWAAAYSDEVFAISTELNLCWDSTSAIWSFIQLLLNGVFTALGPQVEGRLNEISALYGSFVGHSNSRK